jgi:hypothetical protein
MENVSWDNLINTINYTENEMIKIDVLKDKINLENDDGINVKYAYKRNYREVQKSSTNSNEEKELYLDSVSKKVKY